MSEPVTFFNIIRIPENKTREAFLVWKQISDFMESSDDCVSTKLHQSRRDPTRYINYAIHPSEEAFARASQSEEFQRLSKQLIELGVEREASLYDVVHSFEEEEKGVRSRKNSLG